MEIQIPSLAINIVSRTISFVFHVLFDKTNLKNLLRKFVKWFSPIYRHLYCYFVNIFLKISWFFKNLKYLLILSWAIVMKFIHVNSIAIKMIFRYLSVYLLKSYLNLIEVVNHFSNPHTWRDGFYVFEWVLNAPWGMRWREEYNLAGRPRRWTRSQWVESGAGLRLLLIHYGTLM